MGRVRLSRRAEITLRVATAEAARHRHGAVEDVHVLAALLLDPDLAEALRERGTDSARLARLAALHLAAQPAAVGYRAIDVTPTGGALDRIVERGAAARGLLFFWKAVGQGDLLAGLLSDPGSKAAALAGEARLELREAPARRGYVADLLLLLAHDPAYTDLVARVLEEELHKPAGEALYLTLMAQAEGEVVLFPDGSARAADLARTASEQCEAGGGPPDLFLVGTRLVPVSRVVLALDDDLAETLDDAKALAGERGHASIQDVHLLHAMLEPPRPLSRAVQQAGVDLAVVRSHVDAELTALGRGPHGKGKPRRATHLRALLNAGATRAAAVGRPAVDASSLFSVLLRPGSIMDEALMVAGLRAVDVLHAVAHGASPSPPAAAEAGGPEEVVLHDDAYTTMEMVVALLHDIVGLAEGDATRLMLAVHHRGSAVACVRPAPEARALAEAMTARAREAGMPLRVTTRAVAR